MDVRLTIYDTSTSLLTTSSKVLEVGWRIGGRSVISHSDLNNQTFQFDLFDRGVSTLDFPWLRFI